MSIFDYKRQPEELPDFDYYEDLKVLEQLGQHIDDANDYDYMPDSDDVDAQLFDEDDDPAYTNNGWVKGLDY